MIRIFFTFTSKKSVFHSLWHPTNKYYSFRWRMAKKSGIQRAEQQDERVWWWTYGRALWHMSQNLLTILVEQASASIPAKGTFDAVFPHSAYDKALKKTEICAKRGWKRCRKRQNTGLLYLKHPYFSYQTSELYLKEVRCFWFPNQKKRPNPRKTRIFLPSNPTFSSPTIRSTLRSAALRTPSQSLKTLKYFDSNDTTQFQAASFSLRIVPIMPAL